MAHYERLYLILRPAQGSAAGHARLEQRGNRAQISLFVHGVPGQCRLRILIFSSLEPDGAVVDLGILSTSDRGQGTLTQTGIPLPGDASLSACHTLALCLDWPHNQLVMAAPIGQRPAASHWALQKAIDHYLSVPAKTPLPQEAALPLSNPPAEPQAPEAPPLIVPLPEPVPDPSCQPPIDALQPLWWPPALEELKIYFDLLPPCAPFDAPGWRFVKAPLGTDGPAPFCYVGIRPLLGKVLEAAYALPSNDRHAPPDGLENYRYEVGRHQKGYWVLRQSH